MANPLLNIELPVGGGKTLPLGQLTEDDCYHARQACNESQDALSEALAALEVELGTTRTDTVAELHSSLVTDLIGRLPVAQFR